MDLHLDKAIGGIVSIFEENARLREQNVFLAFGLVIVSVAWLKERYKRLQKEKNKKEGD